MATLTGGSGAWRSIQDMLPEVDHLIEQPGDIAKAAASMTDSYETRLATIRQKAEAGIRMRADAAAQMERTVAENLLRCDEREAESIRALDERLRVWRAKAGVLHGAITPFAVAGTRIRQFFTRVNYNGYRRKQRQELESARALLRQAEANRDAEIAWHRQELDRNIARLNKLAQAPELAGAAAELDVARTLSHLPPHFSVFGDVKLRADRFMRFRGEPLQTAQIDFVVVGPQGVFVIEVKNWSGDFVRAGQYHDPYAQIGRQRFLCQVMLRDRGIDTKVRSIISASGELPQKPTGQYVKVLRPAELAGYITWFKGVPLLPDTLEEIVDFMKRRTEA